jgi:hypothetical protein
MKTNKRDFYERDGWKKVWTTDKAIEKVVANKDTK